MKTFDTIAELTLSKLQVGQFVNTGGNTTKGDGGGETYLISASGTAQGDITLANSNIAVLQRARFTRKFLTLAGAIAAKELQNGDSVEISERTTDNGGGAFWDVVLTSTVIPNANNIVISTGNALLSLVLRLSHSVSALSFAGTTISQQINNAFSAFNGIGAGIPLTILVPQNPDGGAYDWDTIVDLSADSWITLKGDGYVSVKATAAIINFVQLGIANKNNESRVTGFSFDCFNQTMTSAIRTGSIRGVDISTIELKATGTGSFTDGILVAGDEAHTGAEPGGGNEQSTFKHIFDSGDSSVTNSMIRFTGGTSLGVIVDNVRATGENWDTVVGSSSTSGFNGCDFKNIHAIMLSVRSTKATAMVYLKRFVTATRVSNVQITGNPSQDNVNFGLLFNTADATVSSSLHTENMGIGYRTKDVSVLAAVLRTHVNSVASNAGDPNSQGPISTNAVLEESGGVVWDETNKTIFVGGNEHTTNKYETAILKRRVTIGDDSFFKLTFPVGDYRLTGTIMTMVPEMSGGVVREAIVSLRTTGTAVANKLTNSAQVDVTTGALTGTTGTDGIITISADSSDGSVFVENRTGAGRIFMISFLT